MGNIRGAVLGLLTVLMVTWGQAHAQAVNDQGTVFDSTQHGFSFENGEWSGVCLTHVGVDKLRYTTPTQGYCFDGWGLCAGMSLLAGERFLAGQQSFSLEKDAAERQIVDAQMRTVTAANVAKWLNWIASPDRGHWHDPNHSVGYKMKKDWEQRIKLRLDRKQPVVIGLVRTKRAELLELRELGAIQDLAVQHAVLALGYSSSNGRVTIRAYDPNYPAAGGAARDIELTFVPGLHGVQQRFASGLPLVREPVRAIMFLRGVPERDHIPVPCPDGKFSTTGEYHGCECTSGQKLYGGILDQDAWCEGAKTCPAGNFSTTGAHRGCKCPVNTSKKHTGIGDSSAHCVGSGAPQCPSGRFSTTGRHRGCRCPAGTKKDYSGLFKAKAKCH